MSRRATGSGSRWRLGPPLAAAVLAALLAVAAAEDAAGVPGGRGPVSSIAPRAAAGFADLEYSVPFYAILFGNSESNRATSSDAEATNSAMHFAEVASVERDGSGLDLSFAVEGQPEASGYQACVLDQGCHDVGVGVTSQGLLYLHAPSDLEGLFWYLSGFPRQPLELSASDAGSGLKVYREVVVGPPAAAAGCEDYGDDAPEMFSCLFLRELLPPGQAGAAGEATLRAGLPPLVQDSDNYRLVFAEEFNGDPPAADDNNCRNGLSTLDDTVWNYHNACYNVDSRGEPCTNVAAGALVMGTAHPCGSPLIGRAGAAKLNSFGKLHLKYGYVEFKYTIDLDHWPNLYQNHNLILYTKGSLRHHRNRYGIKIDDWEDWLKNTEVEIDLVEIDGRQDVAHQYANWGGLDDVSDLRPIRTYKFTNYCGYSAISIIYRANYCRGRDSVTVTRGVEWTPRGYRTYIKFDGIHTGLTLVPKDKILIDVQTEQSGQLTRSRLSAGTDRYFEYITPDDTGTLLEQVAVSHVPLPVSMSAWGWLTDMHPYIRTRMK
ncbi:MAG: hypothetical protein OXC00_02035, partial [Acidimicrobiaceae bacterium]|nr:hypothetical protein [Acidimicrobiaceae bacterium]